MNGGRPPRHRRVPLDRRGDPQSPFALPLGSLAVFVVASLLTPLRETSFGNTNAALVMVVVVSASASLGGRSAGVVTAITAALAYNFFLTRPYWSLHIDDATDVITVVLLVIVGLLIGEFAHQRSRVLTRLRWQTDSTERLERIAELLVSERTHDELCRDVAGELCEQLALRDVVWHPQTAPSGLPVMQRTGWIAASVHRYGSDGYLLPEGGVELPVEYAGARLGSFALVPEPGVGVSSEKRRVAVALSDLLASALARGSAGWLPPPSGS